MNETFLTVTHHLPSSSSTINQIYCQHSTALFRTTSFLHLFWSKSHTQGTSFHFLKLDLVFLLIISHRSSDRTIWGFVHGLCRRNGTDDPKKSSWNELDDSPWRIARRKQRWTGRWAKRVQPLEFTPLSDRGRTAVGPKSDGTRRVSTWIPRQVWMEQIQDWLTVTMTSLHWLSRACRTT